MGEDLKLGRIAGFPLAMNWSVLVIASLLTWSLATHSLPHAAPEHAPATYWLTGLGAATFFFGSLLAHELSHALVARRNDVEVKGITLWLFGGVAELDEDPSAPGADFRIAAAGPATSLGLAGGFALSAVALQAFEATHLVDVAVGWLAGINLLLGLFNLIPGAPLDGGRLLRAYLWRRHGDRARAAITATRAGAIVGYGLIGVGLLEVLRAGGVGGLWLVLIGWFVLGAARAEEADVVTRNALGGLRVADVMTPAPAVAPGWMTVADFIDRDLLRSRQSAYPVDDSDGSIVGLVTLAQLRNIATENRGRQRLLDVAVPLGEVATVTPADSLVSLLDRLMPDSASPALVFDGSTLVGIVTATDVTREAEVRGLHPRTQSTS